MALSRWACEPYTEITAPSSQSAVSSAPAVDRRCGLSHPPPVRCGAPTARDSTPYPLGVIRISEMLIEWNWTGTPQASPEASGWTEHAA